MFDRHTEIHLDQEIVERFKCTLAELYLSQFSLFWRFELLFRSPFLPHAPWNNSYCTAWFHECPQTPAWTALALACPICSMPTILFSQFFCHVGAHRLFHLITWQPKIQAVFCPPGSTCSRTCLRNCHQNRIAGPAAWLSSRPRSQLKKACQFPLGAFIFLFRTHHRFLPNPKTIPIIADLSSKRFHS